MPAAPGRAGNGHRPPAQRFLGFGPGILLAAVLGIGLTFLGVFLAEQQNNQHINHLLRLALANQARILSGSFEFYEAIIYETRDRFSTDPQPTRAEFKKLADTILERAPEIESIAWIPVVTEARREEFERAAKAEGFPDYQFARNGPDGTLIPTGPALEHFPVHFIEPLSRNRRALGYDLASDRLAETLTRAQGPRTVISPLIELPERPGKALGTVALKPVYDTLEQDSSYLPSHRPKGYVAVFFYLPSFVPHVLGNIPDGDIDLLLLDDQAKTNRLVAFRAAGSSEILTGGDNYPRELFAEGLQQDTLLYVGKAQWRLILHPSPKWIAARSSRSSWIIGICGTALTGLAITLLVHASRKAQDTETEVGQRTAELREANDKLKAQIEAQTQTENALRNAQSTLLAAQRLGSTGSWEVDLANSALTWSEPVYRIFGRDPAVFSPSNATFYESVLAEDRAAVKQAAKKAVQDGEPYHVEHRIRLPDGSIRHVQEHAEIVKDSTGKPVRMVGAVRDITAHRIAEANLEKERTMLRTIIDAIPDSIYVKDATGHYILQNRANLDRHGLKNASEGLGKTIFDLTSKELAEKYNQDDWAVIHTAKPLVNREEPFVNANGSSGMFLTTKIAFRDTNGQIAGLVGISRDVTEFKRMAEERQKFDRHLSDAARLESLGVLAGGIAHDFNNLLTGVLGNASLLRLTVPPNAENLEAIAGIETAADKAAELCRQMLAYAGKGRFTIRQFDVNALIRETTVLLRHSVSKKAGLIFHLDKAPLEVEGDETQLGQIVMNLVINASEALAEESGTITISTGTQHASRQYLTEPYLAPDLSEGMYAFIEVSDTGVGMSEEMKTHIFEPFFTTKFAGRGLGLAAALGIVRSHHGALKVTSTLGHGSSFRLLLPLKTKSQLSAASPGPVTPGRELPACRVLLVDDEVSVRAVTKKILISLNCTVTEAVDGEDGLSQFSAQPDSFDLILLDYTMPRLHGSQVAAGVWKLRPALPIVFMSGYNEEETDTLRPGGVTSEPQGPRAFLHKPFSIRELSVKFQAALGMGPVGPGA